jgi:hypothetical protein
MPRTAFSITPHLIAKSRKLQKVQGVFSNRSTTCPTALAITKVLGENVRVEVGHGEVFFATLGDNSQYASITLSKKVRKFINVFDNESAWNGKDHKNPKAQPLAFTLNIPERYAPAK